MLKPSSCETEHSHNIQSVDLYQVNVLKCSVSASCVAGSRNTMLEYINIVVVWHVLYQQEDIWFLLIIGLLCMAGATNENQDSPIFYFILFLSLMAFTLCMFKKIPATIISSRVLMLVACCANFVFLFFFIPQLKQFLDTEVLFHKKK